MNAIHFLSAQPWVERLGSTLLHFLWQGMAIAAVYAAARRSARDARPQVRYLLASTALALMAAAPVLTWAWLSPPAWEPAAGPLTAAVSSGRSTALGDVATTWLGGVYRTVPAPFLSWVVAVWLAGASAFWLRLLGGWIVAGRLRSKLVRPAAGEWQQALDRLKTRVRVSRPVRLLVSSLVQAPAVVGWLRPVVLVPVGVLAGLPAGQVEALLLHELAHIRRDDYLVNALQSVLETLLFYHPAVWWVSGHMRTERELCCDDAAVSASGDVLTYARALAEMESARLVRVPAVMAASGGSLAHRIARLLGEPRPAPRTLAGPAMVVTAMLAAVTTLAVFGQPGARPKFEVASVKPSEGRGFQIVRPLPGRLTADASVKLLMQNAYTLQAYQIAGGPAWIHSDHYQIEAKTDGKATHAQMFVMLQSLLEDRFRLQTHRETRTLPVYALTPARSGLRLPAPKDGSCVPPPPDGDPEWGGGRMPPPGQGQNLTPCGSVGIGLESSGARMRGGKIAMPELIRVLSMVLGRTVVDKTGFSGLFDVQLDFLPDETTAALRPPPPNAAAALEFKTPSIVTALQEQLGLKLESTKGPVEVMVIDHIERPGAN
jgi:uncharacterized protein (TIGR03435 family)